MIAFAPQAPIATVLVVDDDDAVRRLIARELEQDGFRVLSAADGVEALAVLNEGGIEVDLMVCDLLMPQLDGYQLAHRVAALPDAPKIIFTSAFRSNLELDHPVLTKPFHLDDLREAVRGILQNRPMPASENG
jgi:CheY-like chemotaxis protein